METNMKFIHCSDLHLDSKMESNLSSQKARERKGEILNTFERMVKYACDNEVNGIIIAGDMFDTSRISNLTKTRVLNIITKNSEIDFLYLSGNHDESNFISQIDQLPNNLKIFGKYWTTFDYGDIKVHGAILDGNNKTIYDTLNLKAEDFNIVVLHGQIAKYNSKEDGEIINLPKLKDKNIDYLALGHIHNFIQDRLDKRGIYCYSGCLEGRGFDECGEKGFVLLEIDNKDLKTSFIPFAKRKLNEVKFDISGFDDWFDIEDEIVKMLKDFSRENLIKIELIGSYTLNLDKHLSMLEQKLDDFYFAKIKDKSKLKVSLGDVENDISLRGEFIRGVLNSNLKEEEKEGVILIGLKALSGEDF